VDPEKFFVVPAAGLTVIDPASGQALPPEGKNVERSTYWIRRVNEGDVTEGKPTTAAKKAKELAT
jgi:hypothetical protein